MDGPEGREHPQAGAEIARDIVRWLSRNILQEHRLNEIWRGEDAYLYTLFHSRHFSKKCNQSPSKLCWADKYCVWTEPMWFYWLRATLSGELKEYRANHESRTGKISSWKWIKYYRSSVLSYEEIDKLLVYKNTYRNRTIPVFHKRQGEKLF